MGRDLVATYDPNSEADLREANRLKNGAPFLYADGLMMTAAALRTALRVPYRQLSGMLGSMLSDRGSPSYPTLYRRMQLPSVDVRGSEVTVRDPDRCLVMVADATGLKQHRRGEWIRHRWRVRRRFVKLHLPMDADTRGVPAAAVTDERAGDAAQLPALLHMAVGDRRLSGAGGPDRGMLAEGIPPVWDVEAEPAGAVLYADGGYASRANVAGCARPSVAPNIRLPASRTARGRGSGDAWGLLLRRQQGGAGRRRPSAACPGTGAWRTCGTGRIRSATAAGGWSRSSYLPQGACSART